MNSSPTDFDFALARYNGNGSLDTSFDGDGILTTDFNSPSDVADSVAVQDDGKIVVVGSTRNTSNERSERLSEKFELIR